MGNEAFIAFKKRKVAKLDKLLKDGLMTEEQHQEAVKLEKESTPYLLKYHKNGKVKSIYNIFASMQKERDSKGKRKRKKK